jgi:hypothetical protein
MAKALVKRKRNLMDSAQAQEFMREVGDDILNICRALENDCAALRQFTTLAEFRCLLFAVMKAQIRGEITLSEAHKARRAIEKRLKQCLGEI